MKVLSSVTNAKVPDSPPRVPTPTPSHDPQLRKLVVGPEIVLRGEINACDCLVVEGTVKADIAGCKEIQIAKGGLFVGTASVENADIRGRFEGEITVSSKLSIHGTGEVSAKVRYHQIEIESGGDISGDIKKEAAGKPSLLHSA